MEEGPGRQKGYNEAARENGYSEEIFHYRGAFTKGTNGKRLFIAQAKPEYFPNVLLGGAVYIIMKPLLSFTVLIFLSGCHKSNSEYTGSGYWYVQQIYRPVQNYHPIQYVTRHDSAGILIRQACRVRVNWA